MKIHTLCYTEKVGVVLHGAIPVAIPGKSFSVTMRSDWSSPVKSLIRTHTSTSSGPASLAEYVVSLNTSVAPEINMRSTFLLEA